MGIYLNPVSKGFHESLRSEIYIDKSELIAHTNTVINTSQKYLCVSRPRRFGKSMVINMLAAYYSSGEDENDLFRDLKISKDSSFPKHKNKYDVILLNMQTFLRKSDSVEGMIRLLQKRVLKELSDAYKVLEMDREHLDWGMEDVFAVTKRPFIILIDEWDCLFREYSHDSEAQKKYLDFLRGWLKDRIYVGLAYMTGILPIKKYGSHSALNMFSEYSMLRPGELAPFFGFTAEEVKILCGKYKMSFEETSALYDGYEFAINKEPQKDTMSLYSPKSVVEAMRYHSFDTYWNQTETYEALKVYIQMNFQGLKDDIITMLAGGRITISTGTFSNDMTTFARKDDVLVLMIHLGYLTYDSFTSTVAIPNREVEKEYINAIEVIGWNEVIRSVDRSRKLMEALWELDGEAVAKGIEQAHNEVSILQYNDENALSYTINLAFYFAKEYYTIIRELPSGKGFADICLIPRKLYADKPAVVIELKWEMSAKGAIAQIKGRQYFGVLEEYQGNLILAGINYDKRSKIHSCEIEKFISTAFLTD